MPWLDFASSGFRFTKGEPKLYRSSNWLQRGVCSDCGSPLTVTYDDDPSTVVFVGSLDHPDDWPLSNEGWWGHQHVDAKVSWHVISDDLPQFASDHPEMPEGQREAP